MSTRDIIAAVRPEGDGHYAIEYPGRWHSPLKVFDGNVRTWAGPYDNNVEVFPPLGECGPVCVASSVERAAFITTFDPEHVTLMEAVCEAAATAMTAADGYNVRLGESVRNLRAYRMERGL